ncbi:MAG: 30S ribosome-binding factor RbfA [Oscillospiraceae bacterium]|jgi:ribosome-binding factor A|nr:30S ribosome-binding factor RbfA [Oscillospiraceae bacterium]
MNNNKIARINEDITRELSALLREVKDPRVSGAMLTIVRADTSSDLNYCKVYLSGLNVESAKELRKGLKSATGFLRGGLSRSLNLRNTPELTFIIDDSIEQSVKISSMLKELAVDGETSEE